MIPVNEPWITAEDRALVQEALAGGFLAAGGGYVQRFERRWADYCGRRHALAVSSGTAALEIAVHALDLPPGAEVILPDFTIVACARAVIVNGLVPVFVDADPVTWTMDAGALAAAVTPATRAIMPVHIYGHPVDMDAVAEVAARYNLRVIEDAAEAHGARCRGKRCGGFGDISVFSFYANKIVTTGEGGMVLFDDDRYLARCRAYRELGFSADRRFRSDGPGGNHRFTALQAAIGYSQAARIEECIERKKTIAALYDRELAACSGLQRPPRSAWADNVFWMYGVVLRDEVPLDAAMLGAALQAEGIETRPFFLGMHEQPWLRKRGVVPDREFPVSRRLARRGLYLPSGLTLTEPQVRTVAGAVGAILGGAR